DCLSTIVFILPLHLDYTKVIILILWWRNFQLEYWRTFQLVSTRLTSSTNLGWYGKASLKQLGVVVTQNGDGGIMMQVV
ncbi:hypothetical protein L4X33_18115, partial [Phocaeicola vulgatus]|uniref:hypothetical protein n=1 Tax=Phocaeicola vulgatus TaxID=821 RepID=UPI001F277540